MRSVAFEVLLLPDDLDDDDDDVAFGDVCGAWGACDNANNGAETMM